MKSKKLKQKRRLFIARLILFLLTTVILTALICSLAAGGIFLSAGLNGFSLPEKYTVYYGKENNFKIVEDKDEETGEVTPRVKLTDFKNDSYKIGEIADNSTLYVNFSALAEFCGFYVSGERDRIRYILPDSNGMEESYFVVYPDSNKIDLNGTVIHLSVPAVLEGDALYLPLEFVDLYIHGISVETVEWKEDVYYLLCSQTSEYYVTASLPTPGETIDRTMLEESGG